MLFVFYTPLTYMTKSRCLKCFFVFLLLTMVVACSSDSDDGSESDNGVTGTFTYSDSGTGNGIITPVTGCRYNFISNTENLEIKLIKEDGITISGTYTLDIKTEFGSFLGQDDSTCSPITFDETKSGSVTIDGSNIRFTTDIGDSVNLSGVKYTFSGTIKGDVVGGTAEHESLALDNTITYVLTLNVEE